MPMTELERQVMQLPLDQKNRLVAMIFAEREREEGESLVARSRRLDASGEWISFEELKHRMGVTDEDLEE